MNLCNTCGEDFSSVKGFDAHRVGVHEYLASPERPDGRRCLGIEEMEQRGWRRNERGRWFDPSRNPAARLRGRRHVVDASPDEDALAA
jgi:hypothetical protein